MSKFTPVWIAAALVIVVGAACAGSSVPSTSPEAIGTIVAAKMRAITPQTRQTASPLTLSTSTNVLASSPVPPTLQPAGPTAAASAATRINFLNDATTGVVTAPIQAGQTLNFVLQAQQAQPMLVSIDSLNQDVTLSLKTQGGTSMLNASAHQPSWRGTLPQTEDYYLGVYGGASAENFTLTVTLPSRIRFTVGADSTKVIGKTVAGYSANYTIFAIKGQKMTVTLANLSGDAALTIYGFTDGQPYVRAATEQTSFTLKLPRTQDYIIQVVPKGRSTVSYLLNVQIQ